MKNATWLRVSLLMVAVLVQGLYGGPILNIGESVQAAIFAGDEVGTSEGNPAADGQGWYHRNLTTKLNWYEADETHDWDRWANKAEAGGYPSYLSYYTVYEGAASDVLVMTSAHYDAGHGWLYTAAVEGKYEISFDATTSTSGAGNTMLWEVVILRSDESQQVLWEGAGNIPDGGVYGGILEADDGIAFTARNNRAYFAGVTGTVTGLQVTLIPEPGTLALLGLTGLLLMKRRRV